MKSIKVRFWHLDHKQFTYLDLSKIEDLETLINLMEYEVLERQFSTGLKDKNGKEIYEGDIVKVLDRDWPSQLDQYKEMNHQQYLDWLSSYCEVIYSGDRFELKQFRGRGYFSPSMRLHEGRDVFEVIGNIYTTPNLINE